jgi:serine phosphatase RsbU (regulator of sigma subunit)
MSLPAGMQWDLLPPLSARTAGALIAGALEPAYDIAGDAFDYAINGTDLHLAIFDGLGHGLGSTLLTGLAVGAYRHARRDGAPVAGMHAAIDAALAGHYDDISFATGIIARLATGSGRLEWSCAGHPRPLLLRGRKIVAELSCDPVLPFGLGDGAPQPRVAELEPDDAVLMYTDGVTEARTRGRGAVWPGPADRPAGAGSRQRPDGRGTAAAPGARRARASGRQRPARRRHSAAGAVDRHLTRRQPH